MPSLSWSKRFASLTLFNILTLRLKYKRLTCFGILLGVASTFVHATPIWTYRYLGGGDVVSLGNFNNRGDILWNCGQCSSFVYSTPLSGWSNGGIRSGALAFSPPLGTTPSGAGFTAVGFLNSSGQALGSSQFVSTLTGTGGSHPTYWLNGVAFDNSLGTYTALPDPGVVSRDLTSFVTTGTFLDLVSNPNEMVLEISRGSVGDFLARFGSGQMSGLMNTNNYFIFEAGFNRPMHALIPIAQPASTVPEPGVVALISLGLAVVALQGRRTRR